MALIRWGSLYAFPSPRLEGLQTTITAKLKPFSVLNRPSWLIVIIAASGCRAGNLHLGNYIHRKFFLWLIQIV